jgi:hypothetical protein
MLILIEYYDRLEVNIICSLLLMNQRIVLQKTKKLKELIETLQDKEEFQVNKSQPARKLEQL